MPAVDYLCRLHTAIAMDRYELERNFEKCFLTDTELHIRVSWENGDYSGTKEFSFLPECTIVRDAKTAAEASQEVAQACSCMDRYIEANCPDLV